MANTPDLAVADATVLISQPAAVNAKNDNPNDALLRLALSASDDATKSAVPVIAKYCTPDLVAWCQEQVALANEANRVAARSPSVVIEALRHVHGCLARNVDALSPRCADAVRLQFGPKELSVSPFTRVDKDDESEEEEQGDRGDRKQHVRRPKPKHHHKHHPKEDDEEDDDRPTRRETGVEIYIFNGNNDDDIGRRIGHKRHGDGRGGAHPLVWMLVLPFFFVGLYVVMRRVHALARRRLLEYRERERQRSHAHSDAVPLVVPTATGYAPLKTTDTDEPLH
ncbi:hypothetical protein PINS_up011961 [Pythium insidiosum]|nr:hypothetical protein PINS_up011961 [Pythium insidiosum]